MKKKTRLIITLAIFATILGAAIAAFLVFSNQKNDKVIAKVNGQKIYQSEIEDKLNKMFQNQNREQKIVINNFPAQVVEALVQDIYLQKELNKIAEKSPIAKDKNLKKQIEDYKNTTLRQAYLDSIIAGKVNDQTIKNKYSEISSELSGKKEVHLKHILVLSEDEAKKIVALLKKKNSSFEKLAKQYSKDEANAAMGGDLGYVIPDNLDEDFAKAVAELKKNQISNPIKTKFGWHLVKVEDIRNVDLPAFESVKSTIEDNLKQEIIEEVFAKITKDAKVKILIDLKPAPEKDLVAKPVQEEPQTKAADETKK
ncbi:MAG: peptidylprolyl isomerase [Pseudomonadota bacterium]